MKKIFKDKYGDSCTISVLEKTQSVLFENDGEDSMSYSNPATVREMALFLLQAEHEMNPSGSVLGEIENMYKYFHKNENVYRQSSETNEARKCRDRSLDVLKIINILKGGDNA